MKTSYYKNKTRNGTILEQLDPRIKIICFFTLILTIILTPKQNLYRFLLYLIIILLLVFLSKISLRVIALRLLIIIPLLLFLSLIVLFFNKYQLSKNLTILWNLFIKSFLTLLTLITLNMSTQFNMIIKALESIKTPKIILTIISFAYRYFFLFLEETERIRRAKTSRQSGSKNVLKEAKIILHIIPHLLSKVLGRSERIYISMLSRGYNNNFRSVNLLKLRSNDYLFMFLFYTVLCLIIFIL